MRRMLAFIVTAAFVFGLSGAADAAKQCRDDHGKFIKCPAAAAGNTSSPASPADPHTTPAMAAATPTGPAAMGTSGAGPQCKKGKRCGNSCISVKDVCHK